MNDPMDAPRPALPACWFYMQGFHAFEAGVPLAENPELGLSAGKDWAAGWLAAEREALAEYTGSYGGTGE